MLAGKLAGFCSRLFGTNCWAEQTAFSAKGDEYDEFLVNPSERSIEKEIESLLATDRATRADMAVAMQKLEKEVSERKSTEQALKKSEDFERVYRRARDKGLRLFEDRFVRFAGKPQEHSAFFLVDPSNNLVEFKHYLRPETMY